MQPLILAIDLGTGGPKVALVDLDGQILAGTARPVRTRTPEPDLAVQDPHEIREAIFGACREVLSRGPVEAEAVVGIALTSQFASLIAIGKDDQPVSDLILWLTRRGTPWSRQVLASRDDAFLRWLDIHGAVPMGNDPLSHLLFLANERPEIWARTSKVLEPADWLALEFTGNISSNPCSAFLMLLTDNRNIDAIDWSTELLEVAGVDRDKLPRLVPVDARVGSLRPQLAAELGLRPGTPVFAPVNDTQAATVGSGAFRPGFGGANIGTTIQILGSAKVKHTDIETSIVSMPSPFPGEWMALAESGLGGKVLDHFLGQLVHARDPFGDHRRDDLWLGLDDAVGHAPAGSGGLVYLPWLAGSQAPRTDAHMRGGFLGMSLETTRAHMARAVLEGIACTLRWMLPAVERFSGSPFEQIAFSGGGATSDAWAAILADVLGRRIEQLAEPRQTNTRGVAFLAFQRLGLAGRDDLARFRPVKRVWEPRPEHRSLYGTLFERHIAVYDAVEPLFRPVPS